MYYYLHSEIKNFFSTSQPLIDQMMALDGECFRHQNGRMTQRVVLGGKHYFIKQHFGVGWKEIFKNILQWRWPVISAKNEWRAIEKLKSFDVPVPKVVAYGQQGIHPARMQSFILMEELAPVISLEELCRTWQHTPPNVVFKRMLLEKVAHIARTLHQHGMNHRDFYICHFLLETSGELNLYLIDLHRAQLRRRTPERWMTKDLAGLYFSSKDIGLTQRDLYRFMKRYAEKSLHDIFCTQKTFWQQVKKRGEKLYRDHLK